jgi:hypothetical protein
VRCQWEVLSERHKSGGIEFKHIFSQWELLGDSVSPPKTRWNLLTEKLSLRAILAVFNQNRHQFLSESVSLRGFHWEKRMFVFDLSPFSRISMNRYKLSSIITPQWLKNNMEKLSWLLALLALASVFCSACEYNKMPAELLVFFFTSTCLCILQRLRI